MNPRVILHLDMDAFYASIEERDHPELRGKPIIVGGSPTERGVVCAASYAARKFGVRSATPSRRAAQLCPTGIFLRPRMDHYLAESKAIRKILEATGAIVEATSIDEAYLDITDLGLVQEKYEYEPPGLELARKLKREIHSDRGLTASIGLAPNKLLAKLASDFQKPDGLTWIGEADKIAFLRPLPVRAIHGVGAVTEQLLQREGLMTIGDIQDFPGDLKGLFGSFGPILKNYSLGEDARAVDNRDETKSISSEETFARDTSDRRILRKSLWAMSSEIASSLKRKRLAAYTVQVKLRYSDFTTLTRQITVEESVEEKTTLYRLACFLLQKEKLADRPLRLLGVGVSSLGDPKRDQLLLSPDRNAIDANGSPVGI